MGSQQARSGGVSGAVDRQRRGQRASSAGEVVGGGGSGRACEQSEEWRVRSRDFVVRMRKPSNIVGRGVGRPISKFQHKIIQSPDKITPAKYSVRVITAASFTHA